MLRNIPQELRDRNQWVCAGPDKIPINPRTRKAADVSDPTTWGTFEEAVNAGYLHVGYVLWEDDPYTIIDLDKPENDEQWARHQLVLNAFDTYTEKSQSGVGYHLIMRGKAVSARRDKVEVYSRLRYMICTGNVVRSTTINDCQGLLNVLTSEMNPPTTTTLEDREGLVDDKELVDMAMRATNADKFNALCRGETTGYPSQSEADFALLSILAFYTPNNEQVRRLFRMSNLGKRDKATRNDTYLDRALRKIRSNEPPPVDFKALQTRVTAPPEPTPTDQPPCPFPPGLLGEVADYIYRSAVRPVPEIALAGAITVMAGVAGRQYNLPSTGLNMYTILLARTGSGKEGAASGINRLFHAVRTKVPMIDQFRGPATFASGPALAKSLVEKPCQFAILGEFGLFLKEMCNTNAFGPTLMLKRAFLDLYHKSGWNQVLLGTEYSDREKNTGIVAAPCLTLLGESTQETFLAGLSTEMIRDGLIPRFLIVEYSGHRPYLNPNAGHEPSPDLVNNFSTFSAGVLQMATNNTCAMVEYTPTALALAHDFEKHTTDTINSDHALGHAEVWNRAHIKAIKLAALTAVGLDPHNPTITDECMSWAINIVERDTKVLLSRFDAGDVGNGDSKQLVDLRRTITTYFERQPTKGYKVPPDLYKARLLPLSYLILKTAQLASFTGSRLGATQTLANAVRTLVETGELVEVPKQQLYEKFKTSQKVYALGDNWS